MTTANPQQISEAARVRGLVILMMATFFTWGGFFMVVPLIGVYYVNELGWAAASIGVVLAVRQFTQQGLTTFSGAIADKVGAKWLIAGGLFVRAFGFAGMAWADTYPALMATIVLSAIGGAMFDSPKSAAIAALTREDERARYFSISGVVIGLGITIGTQAGALLLKTSFDLVAIISGASYLLIFLMVALLFPPVQVAQGVGGFWHGFGLAVHDRPFRAYVGLMTGQWFMNTQFALAMPLTAVALTGRTETVAWVTGLNSLVALVLGYPLPRLLDRRMGSRGALVLGCAVTALGVLSIGFAGSTPQLLAAVFVFACGTTIVRPMEQTVAAGLANPDALGSYFGMAALSVAVGGGFGNVFGGLLYDVGRGIGVPGLPWFVCAAVGALTVLGLHVSLRPKDHRHTQPVPVVQ
jgi:MFS transporter, DHA1 family, multidrug resistance protein